MSPEVTVSDVRWRSGPPSPFARMSACWRRLAGVFVALGWLSSCGRAQDDAPQAGSNSNWLRQCSDGSSCGPGLECWCGVCTKPCEQTSDCPGSSQCLARTGACNAGAAPSACGVTCDLDVDCAVLGAGTRCVAPLCVALPDSGVAEAGAPGAPPPGAMNPDGEENNPNGLPTRSLCADSPVLADHDPASGVYVIKQAEVDALEGCEEILYDFYISAGGGIDLRPLHALRVVRGHMSVQYAVSLAGLEQLEWVTEGLSLRSLSAPSLRPLAHLTLAGSNEESPEDGGIAIGYCNELEDLSGLEALEDFTSIAIDNNERLRSVWPLTPGANLEVVALTDNPALVDIGSFDTLENVRRLQVDQNGVLADLSALRRLRTAEYVGISNNGALTAVDFPDLDLVGVPDLVGGVSIAYNAELQRIDLPALQRAETVEVRQNVKLGHLDLSGLVEAQSLVIALNFELPENEIVLNPNLSETTFRRIGGNGSPFQTEAPDSSVPDFLVLNPCPFADDGYCDECSWSSEYVCSSGLCGYRTDGADCPAQ